MAPHAICRFRWHLAAASVALCFALIPAVGLASGRTGGAELPSGIDAQAIVDQVMQNRAGGYSTLSDGTQFQVGCTPVYGPAWKDQTGPAVAFDGTNYLVVWSDSRASGYMELGGTEIFGARVSTAGVLVDPVGIMITDNAIGQYNPAIDFDGTNYLVVWEQDGLDTKRDIWGARLSTAGVVLDPSGFAVSQADSNQNYPAVVFSGARYLVVWEDYRNGTARDIYGCRVTTAGSVLEPSGIAISTATGDQWEVDLDSDGSGWLVVWNDSRSDANYDVYGARVNEKGVVLDAAGFAIYAGAGAQTGPAVAYGVSVDVPPQYNYVVVWGDTRSGDTDIYGTRVTTAGVVLDPAGVAISTATNGQVRPDIAFEGMYFLVAWHDYRNSTSWPDIYGCRLTLRGGISVRDPNGIAISLDNDAERYVAVAAASPGFLVVWDDDGIYSCQTAAHNVYGARVANDGTVGPAGISISESANFQSTPAAAFDGTNYLVVWLDQRTLCRSDIYGTRVSQAGVILDPAGIAICAAAQDQNDPAVAFDGTNYLVIWHDYRNGFGNADIYGTRVSQAGVVLDAANIGISTGTGHQLYPGIVFDGTNYIATWADYRSGTSYDIYACRVSTAGVVLDATGVAIASGAQNELHPSITHGANTFVAWMDNRNATNTGWDVYGTRVSGRLDVLDPGGVAISAATGNQQYPALAFDGTNYFAVWEDSRNGSEYDIYGARVSDAALVLDPSGIAISTAATDQYQPRLAYDGEGYLVVWMDERDVYRSVYGAWVGTDGTVYDPSGIALEAGGHDHDWPCVLADAGDPLLLLYSAFSAPPNYGHFRIYGDFVASTSGVDVPARGGIGDSSFGIADVRPNPFSGETTVRFAVLAEGVVDLAIYDVAGRRVATLAEGRLAAGKHTAAWSGRDDRGRQAASGIYFCRLATGDRTQVAKVLLVR